jgi:hypothetical protein
MTNKVDSKRRVTGQDDFARFAIEDFGTVDVPIPLRREARLLAARTGITPKQALDRLRADTSALENTKNDSRNAASRVKPAAKTPDRPRVPAPHGRGVQSNRPGEPPPKERQPIWVLRREAIANGRKWMNTTCTVCNEVVFIHIEWEKPLILCKRCRADRAARLRSDRHRRSKKLPAKGTRRSRPISGGLPSLGKRR